MCLILFAINEHPEFPFMLIANRDEFYSRPTRSARYWDDHPNIFAGRDLRGGGTWLGVTRSGRIAAVTNYRDPSAPGGVRSRGDLVADFLKGEVSAAEYVDEIGAYSGEFSGFNLLVGEITPEKAAIFYYSNRGGDVVALSEGIYGLSNHLLDTPWPKVVRARGEFTRLMRAGATEIDAYFRLLADESLADDADLPATGLPYEAEKALSAIMIKTPVYGTRSSAVVYFDRDGRWQFEEKVLV